jgi:hypothetical protein
VPQNNIAAFLVERVAKYLACLFGVGSQLCHITEGLNFFLTVTLSHSIKPMILTCVLCTAYDPRCSCCGNSCCYHVPPGPMLPPVVFVASMKRFRNYSVSMNLPKFRCIVSYLHGSGDSIICVTPGSGSGSGSDGDYIFRCEVGGWEGK